MINDMEKIKYDIPAFCINNLVLYIEKAGLRPSSASIPISLPLHQCLALSIHAYLKPSPPSPAANSVTYLPLNALAIGHMLKKHVIIWYIVIFECTT